MGRFEARHGQAPRTQKTSVLRPESRRPEPDAPTLDRIVGCDCGRKTQSYDPVVVEHEGVRAKPLFRKSFNMMWTTDPMRLGPGDLTKPDIGLQSLEVPGLTKPDIGLQSLFSVLGRCHRSKPEFYCGSPERSRTPR
jgi:hypothetical protein